MKLPSTRFVITGMGLVNSLGSGVDNTFTKLFNSKQPTPKVDSWDTRTDPAMLVHRAFELPDLDQLEQTVYTEHESRNWPLLTKAAMLAVDEAVRQSGFTTTNVATLISSISGGNDARNIVEIAYNSGKTKANPFQTLGISYDFTTGAVAAKYGWHGPSTVMVSACATGIYTLDYGIKCLAAGDCDIAVVGGTDAMVEKYDMYFFQVLRALSKRDEDYISQPFSDTRDGFILGEGAGVVVVETLEHAQARGATILAEICGIGFYTETAHPTSPTEDGMGATSATVQALTRSGVIEDDIAFVSAHATSTPAGDVIEYDAMNKLFPNAYITSNKGHIGHTMSASGLIELIYGIKSLETKQVPPVANFTSCEFEKDITIVKSTKTITKSHFVKNSYGFGGKCSSVVVGIPAF